MATARRTRTISAPIQRVWELIADPDHMPRWWPGVVRMESVSTNRFTQVFQTKRGRPVRMDFQVLVAEPPYHLAWSQEIPGTPFERVLGESVTEVVLKPEGQSTEVTIAWRQKMRGYSRTGGLLLRRASGRKLAEALDSLERALVDPR